MSEHHATPLDDFLSRLPVEERRAVERRTAELIEEHAAAVREAEASRVAATCHSCGGECIDDGAEPCDQCGGGGLEFESIVVEGQVSG